MYRKLDGRPKLFLRRFFSSIGLNSVGRLVKGGRSSSMEQLSIPAAARASSASPSPTRRPQPTIRIQRTPSLQTLHTVNKTLWKNSHEIHLLSNFSCRRTFDLKKMIIATFFLLSIWSHQPINIIYMPWSDKAMPYFFFSFLSEHHIFLFL